jgi:hypothetical protein
MEMDQVAVVVVGVGVGVGENAVAGGARSSSCLR